MDVLPDEMFAETDDLPVEDWSAHRGRSPEPLPPPADLDRTDKAAAVSWLTERKRRLDEAVGVVPMLAFFDRVSVLGDGFDWMAHEHTIGGTVCGRVRLIGVRLTPRQEIHRAFRDIALRWHGSDLGAAWSPLTSLREYQDAVNRLGLGTSTRAATRWTIPGKR